MNQISSAIFGVSVGIILGLFLVFAYLFCLNCLQLFSSDDEEESREDPKPPSYEEAMMARNLELSTIQQTQAIFESDTQFLIESYV